MIRDSLHGPCITTDHAVLVHSSRVVVGRKLIFKNLPAPVSRGASSSLKTCRATQTGALVHMSCLTR
jgi:hypothetical protein